MGHTKTAISLPDELFRQLEASAEAERTTRSAIVVRALESHFERESSADFISRMNSVYEEPWSEEELREEAALAGARTRAFRRINELLRSDEAGPWRA